VTALCRYFADRGECVAPFKAQNMSNNATVTAAGGEIGRAQYLQAPAARANPDVRMNPVLLKPGGDTITWLTVLGTYSPELTAVPWMDRRDHLWPIVRLALPGLLAEFDRDIIKGAGSPAEVNLRAGDIVNMSVARDCQADVYLVDDS
jgi:adenosylcobyric acid synthase